jgi:hypothetical protein
MYIILPAYPVAFLAHSRDRSPIFPAPPRGHAAAHRLEAVDVRVSKMTPNNKN